MAKVVNISRRTTKCCNLLSCSRALSSTVESNVPKAVERRHTSEGSFRRINQPFLSHPTSIKPAATSTPRSPLLMEVISLLRKEPPPASLSRQSLSHSTGEVLFLSREELASAERSARERAADLATTVEGGGGRRERGTVKEELVRDPGLEWLYEGDVTFVDCSSTASNQDRYIATRSVDGTLYHNAHPDRDSINGSFFPVPGQIYPPLEVFEEDALFAEAIGNPDIPLVSLLELLGKNYSPEDPRYRTRLRQLAGRVDENNIESVIFSPHFIRLLEEGGEAAVMHIHRTLLETGRTTLADGVSRLLLSKYSHLPCTNPAPHSFFIVEGNDLLFPYSELKNVPHGNINLFKAASICELPERAIKSCVVKWMEGRQGLLVTLHPHSPSSAWTLHDQGRGRILHFREHCFPLVPVRRKR